MSDNCIQEHRIREHNGTMSREQANRDMSERYWLEFANFVNFVMAKNHSAAAALKTRQKRTLT